jgi:hypothetical protein
LGGEILELKKKTLKPLNKFTERGLIAETRRSGCSESGYKGLFGAIYQTKGRRTQDNIRIEC